MFDSSKNTTSSFTTAHTFFLNSQSVSDEQLSTIQTQLTTLKKNHQLMVQEKVNNLIIKHQELCSVFAKSQAIIQELKLQLLSSRSQAVKINEEIEEAAHTKQLLLTALLKSENQTHSATLDQTNSEDVFKEQRTHISELESKLQTNQKEYCNLMFASEIMLENQRQGKINYQSILKELDSHCTSIDNLNSQLYSQTQARSTSEEVEILQTKNQVLELSLVNAKLFKDQCASKIAYFEAESLHKKQMTVCEDSMKQSSWMALTCVQKLQTLAQCDRTSSNSIKIATNQLISEVQNAILIQSTLQLQIISKVKQLEELRLKNSKMTEIVNRSDVFGKISSKRLVGKIANIKAQGKENSPCWRMSKIDQ